VGDEITPPPTTSLLSDMHVKPERTEPPADTAKPVGQKGDGGDPLTSPPLPLWAP